MRETRAVPLRDVSVRAVDGDTPEVLFTGHAAVFDSRTWIGPPRWGFYEEIAPGAFRDVLNEDTAFLFNHDPNYILARNGSTMTLAEDATGLLVDARFDSDDPDTQRVVPKLQRGDVKGMSFSFDVAEDEWTETDDGSAEIRRIIRFRHLYDVASVTFPAYPDAAGGLAAARAIDVIAAHRGLPPEHVREAVRRGEEPPTPEPTPTPTPQLTVLRHPMTPRRHPPTP